MKNQKKNIFRTLSGWTWAFVALLASYLFAGVFAVGSFRSTGKAFTYVADTNNVAVYDLTYADGAETALKAIYLNIGNIYKPAGEDLTVTIKRTSSSAASTRPSTTFRSSSSGIKVGNIYSASGQGRAGANYNWIVYAVNETPQTTRRISVAADGNFELNEIVCIGADGKRVEMSVNASLSTGFTTSEKQLARAIDAPKSFVKSNSAYYNFTQNEQYYMTSIHTVLGGGKVTDGSVYTVDRDHNALATVLMLPSVAIFGDSTGALRLSATIYTALTLVIAYAFASMLFKSKKYGFVFALLLALGGYATTIGGAGAPYAILTCMLLASAYFAYRFYANGISSRRVVRGGLNVLFSGLTAAVAMTVNVLAAIPVLGVLVLLGFGMKRQKAAYAYELKKAEDVGAPVEEKDKLKATYVYKRRICLAFAVVSFVASAFLLTLLGTTGCYSAYVKAYDDPLAPSLGFASLLWKGISAPFAIDNITSFTAANAINAFSWLLPFKAATAYRGVITVGANKFLRLTTGANPALTALSLVGLIFSTVTVFVDWCGKQRADKRVKRVRRAYFVCLVGAIACILASAFVKNASAVSGFTFSVFYAGFIPLSALILEGGAEKKSKAANICLWVSVGAVAAAFVLCMPSFYGFTVPAWAEKAFSWMYILK